MFEKNRQRLGPQAQGLRRRERRFFFRVAQNSDLETSHRATQRHSAKTLHNTRHLTLHGTLHRHHEDRQHVVKPAVLSHIPVQKNSGTLSLKMDREAPETLKERSPRLIFCDDRAADGRKHSAK